MSERVWGGGENHGGEAWKGDAGRCARMHRCVGCGNTATALGLGGLSTARRRRKSDGGKRTKAARALPDSAASICVSVSVVSVIRPAEDAGTRGLLSRPAPIACLPCQPCLISSPRAAARGRAYLHNRNAKCYCVPVPCLAVSIFGPPGLAAQATARAPSPRLAPIARKAVARCASAGASSGGVVVGAVVIGLEEGGVGGSDGGDADADADDDAALLPAPRRAAPHRTAPSPRFVSKRLVSSRQRRWAVAGTGLAATPQAPDYSRVAGAAWREGSLPCSMPMSRYQDLVRRAGALWRWGGGLLAAAAVASRGEVFQNPSHSWA
ncbi:uncharacterized protein K452DRAFT_312773 [Aplosporella prunicola CBS 121167]|uniref:Uncharacterized protein n=1 Tax=Aplosporella prunicola CBS 121167 TaxID=1176127 RepID=A0A6A6AYG2_9PEZI|nr:uncharacterized protein K452DRAFT_312773 [Aplosporella prunicola CBS 121167]KAF2136969.1 hypothetical protein K452DRAFT_312773 [Aplosporella prunicola CBS 121167]